MLIIAALYLGILPVYEHTSSSAMTVSIGSCQHELALCATGGCRPAHVTKECPIAALRPRELRILQTELNSATNKLKALPAPISVLCLKEFDSYFAAALDEMEQGGRILHYDMKALQQKFHGADLEAFYRAGIESNITGIAVKAAHIEGARDTKFKKCPLAPTVSVILLRAQNLAFARDNRFLAKMKLGKVDPQLLRPFFHTFLHADLWQQAQEDALPVFENLQAQGKYPAGPVNNFRSRVAAHIPLYDDGTLANGWPRCTQEMC